MSRWVKFRDKVLRPLVGAGAKLVPLPGAGFLGEQFAGYKSRGLAQLGGSPGNGWDAMPGGSIPPTGAQMASLPAIVRGGGAIAGRAAGPLGAAMSAGTIARSAMTYCRRHPAWCSTIGLAGVAELIRGGSLPPIKKRRARGITGRELSSFKRVSRVLNTWCKVPAPTQRARRKC